MANNRRKRYVKPKPKFTAASKLIGVIVFIAMLGIIIYAMIIIPKVAEDAIKAGITPDMGALNTLIGGILGVACAYIGFYINMAKAEHIEDKKNEIKKQIHKIEQDGITQEEMEKLNVLKEELMNLNDKLDNISGDENIGGYNG